MIAGLGSKSRRPVVAIVGGGFSGSATAYHLARLVPPSAVSILVIEPRASLGQGLAYSTTDPDHRVNVPASRMSLDTEDRGDFSRWLEATDVLGSDPEALGPDGHLYPRRAAFGAYVGDRLRPFLDDGAVVHVRARAFAVERVHGSYLIRLSDGSYRLADVLVIATTHPKPALPAQLRALAQSPRLIADPYDLGRLRQVGARDAVLVVGAGLTSADVVASLDRRGHAGPILALSRHGLRSRAHGPAQPESAADFSDGPAPLASEVLRRVRASVAADAARGLTWHAALDRVRAQGPAIWAALDDAGRARVVRHLRTFWDVHRFRIAPQVSAVLERRLGEGTLAYAAGRLVGARAAGPAIEVAWRPRGDATLREAHFDHVVVTTGPDHRAILESNPVVASLARLGMVQADPLGLGLLVGADSTAIPMPGRPAAPILVSGPLARGTVGELMGLPEVTAHAEGVARRLARLLALEAEAARDQGWALARAAGE